MSTQDNAARIESKPSPRPGVPVLERRAHFCVRVPAPAGETAEIDLTRAITEGIAHELWRRFGGNSVVNWMQAEAIVDRLGESLAAANSPAPARSPAPTTPTAAPRQAA